MKKHFLLTGFTAASLLASHLALADTIVINKTPFTFAVTPNISLFTPNWHWLSENNQALIPAAEKTYDDWVINVNIPYQNVGICSAVLTQDIGGSVTVTVANPAGCVPGGYCQFTCTPSKGVGYTTQKPISYTYLQPWTQNAKP